LNNGTLPSLYSKNENKATGKLYHLRLRVECTLFCNLQSRARTYSINVPLNEKKAQLCIFIYMFLPSGRRFSQFFITPQLVNFITCGCESSAPFSVIYKAGREPTPHWWISVSIVIN
jgi:hypothetical protein